MALSCDLRFPIGPILIAAMAFGPGRALASEFRFNPKTEGALLIQLSPVESLRPGAVYELNIQEFDPETRNLRSASARGAAVADRPGFAPATPKRWMVMVARPGRYVVTMVSHRTTWNVCYNKGTFAFDVVAGQVSFLGAVDPNPGLSELKTMPTVSANSQMFFSLDRQALPLKTPSELPDWQTDARTIVTEAIPGAGRLEAADPQPVVFNTGRSLLGSRVCTGYYSRKGG